MALMNRPPELIARIFFRDKAANAVRTIDTKCTAANLPPKVRTELFSNVCYAEWPRWCLWQTPDGRLQVDDLETGDWALPYPTVHMALRFIASRLLADC